MVLRASSADIFSSAKNVRRDSSSGASAASSSSSSSASSAMVPITTGSSSSSSSSSSDSSAAAAGAAGVGATAGCWDFFIACRIISFHFGISGRSRGKVAFSLNSRPLWDVKCTSWVPSSSSTVAKRRRSNAASGSFTAAPSLIVPPPMHAFTLGQYLETKKIGATKNTAAYY